MFAVAGKQIQLFDLTTNKEVTLQAHLPEFDAIMAFSPDGRLLAVGAKKGIRLWDTTTGEERRSMGQGKGHRFGITFTDNGKTLLEPVAEQDGRSIKVWDVATGKLLRNFRMPGITLYMAISPDGRLGAGVSLKYDQQGLFLEDARILVWDLKTGQGLHELRADMSAVRHLAFSPDGRSLACVYEVGGVIRLWETATGRERRRFEGHRQGVHCLAFSADGSLLATGAADNTALVWDVLGRLDNGPSSQRDLSAEQLQALWTNLKAKDAAVSYRAMCRLLAGRQTAAFLRKQLQPVVALDAGQREQLTRWIADLDSPQFDVREKAGKELERLGELAEPVLRTLLAGKPSLEVRRRVKAILENLDPARSPSRMQALRAVEVLENIPTAEAQYALTVLAGGVAEARLTREAKASLERSMRQGYPAVRDT